MKSLTDKLALLLVYIGISFVLVIAGLFVSATLGVFVYILISENLLKYFIVMVSIVLGFIIWLYAILTY